ncbi:hypothetical protein FGG44_gp34 [Mycobacterium phage MacnCheese]|uniref:Uncharacterized protein n=1 Tax=Mycobacterium phage MacnCheese TaxID=2927982 RepID=I6XHS1_9CAUD|nr:hypothetical protein FGG44_gp34 [Mycobacterium phage MacnCheese]AFN37729.1 hypothetical protein MACNCHEESE_34 [Mycobacterium phage MacnCheese]
MTLGPQEWVSIAAGSSLLTGLAGNLLGRKRDNFSALTEAYGTLIERVTGLETRLDTVETKYDAERAAHDKERDAHAHTRSLLSIAMVFIRNVMNWGAGDRVGPLPVPPAELMAGE